MQIGHGLMRDHELVIALLLSVTLNQSGPIDVLSGLELMLILLWRVELVEFSCGIQSARNGDIVYFGVLENCHLCILESYFSTFPTSHLQQVFSE